MLEGSNLYLVVFVLLPLPYYHSVVVVVDHVVLLLNQLHSKTNNQ